MRQILRTMHIILLGQFVSGCIALTGIFSTILVNQGISLPAAQSLLNYVALTVVYGGNLILGKQPLKAAPQKFAGLAAVDVVANFCLVEAFNFTSLTSITLLDCWTVPSVLFLTWLLLGAQYRAGHFLGAAICVAAIILLLVTDEEFHSRSSSKNVLLGDALVLFGASLYAVSNVLQEKLLVDVGRIEVMAMLGLFGTLWSALLAGLLEGSAIRSTPWTWKAILPFVGFSVALFAFSSVVPFVLLRGGATVLNLSLLTSDVWAAIARQAFFGGFTAASAISFAAAFILVSIGIVVFSITGNSYERLSPGNQVQTDGVGDRELMDERGLRQHSELQRNWSLDPEHQSFLEHNSRSSGCSEERPRDPFDSEQSQSARLALAAEKEGDGDRERERNTGATLVIQSTYSGP